MEPLLYVWDDTVFVLARGIEEARHSAVKRTQHFPLLVSMVREKCPLVFKCPVVQVVFHKGTPGDVAEMCGSEKVVACVPFKKAIGEGAEYAYHPFTSVIVRDSQGTLRAMEVRGHVELDNFPDGLVHSPT